MSKECATIHGIAKSLTRFYFPFDEYEIPLNGVYVLFENGELGHGQERIVRVGTHTGNDQLRSRLKQHFVNENKDRSIFRKHIGRSILSKKQDPFSPFWEIDLTSKKNKDAFSSMIDLNYQQKIEAEVSLYIQNNFSFCIIPIEEKVERLYYEKRIISTLSWCNECKKSQEWLGNYSPNSKVVKSGLWLVNELYKTPLDIIEINKLRSFIQNNK